MICGSAIICTVRRYRGHCRSYRVVVCSVRRYCGQYYRHCIVVCLVWRYCGYCRRNFVVVCSVQRYCRQYCYYNHRIRRRTRPHIGRIPRRIFFIQHVDARHKVDAVYIYVFLHSFPPIAAVIASVDNPYRTEIISANRVYYITLIAAWQD